MIAFQKTLDMSKVHEFTPKVYCTRLQALLLTKRKANRLALMPFSQNESKNHHTTKKTALIFVLDLNTENVPKIAYLKKIYFFLNSRMIHREVDKLLQKTIRKTKMFLNRLIRLLQYPRPLGLIPTQTTKPRRHNKILFEQIKNIKF